MKRSKEFTEEEKQKLLAEGYKPVEIWVPDWENPVMQKRLKKEAAAIRAADRRDDLFEWLGEVFAPDKTQ